MTSTFYLILMAVSALIFVFSILKLSYIADKYPLEKWINILIIFIMFSSMAFIFLLIPYTKQYSVGTPIQFSELKENYNTYKIDGLSKITSIFIYKKNEKLVERKIIANIPKTKIELTRGGEFIKRDGEIIFLEK